MLNVLMVKRAAMMVKVEAGVNQIAERHHMMPRERRTGLKRSGKHSNSTMQQRKD